MQQLGRHLIFEFWGCNGEINSPESFREVIPLAVEAIGATLLDIKVHTFSPQGVTGLAVLAESHLSLHSWPEHHYLAADVFTCGDRVDPLLARDVLERRFEPAVVHVAEISRGVSRQECGRPTFRLLESTQPKSTLLESTQPKLPS